MSQPRYNKNGIRILDDPKVNPHPKERKCLPGQHSFREVSREYERDGKRTKYECQYCPEKNEKFELFHEDYY